MATSNTNNKRTSQGTRSGSRSNTTKSSTRTNSTRSSSRTYNSGSRTSSRTSRNTNSRSSERDRLDQSVQNELILLVVVAVCILLFLCNFNIIGVFGNAVSSVMFGLFGLISYILPLAAIIFTLFRIFNRENSVVTRKLISAGILTWLIMLICEMGSGRINADLPINIGEIYSRCSENRKGGGIFGGVPGYYLVKLLGNAGTWMLVIVLVIICIVLITGKSLFAGIKEQGQMFYEESVEDHKAKREDRDLARAEKIARKQERIEEKRRQNEEYDRQRKLKEQEREDEKTLRMDRKHSGVSYDLTLNPVQSDDTLATRKTRDDVHTISVTDESEYKESIRHSAVAHDMGDSLSSDATREITVEYDSDQYTGYEPENVTPVTEYVEPAGEAIVEHKIELRPETPDINSLEVDQSAYGAGGLKPEESYAKEYGNTMSHSNNGNRVVATKTETSKQAQPRQIQTNQTTKQSAEVTSGTNDRKPVQSTVYKFPPVSLLTEGKKGGKGNSENELTATASKLQSTLETFGVRATITDYSRGPAVTRYEITPEPGVKVSKIVGLSDDLKLSLAATDIRIEAPIPGKSAVGIEVPNKENEAVAFRDLIESKEFKSSNAALPFAVGKDIGGQIIVSDIAKMPHVLIAGATGSGKSVCINTIIMSILYKAKPDDVRLIMIDPKVVELSVYNPIPHLLLPVVTDPKKAAGALNWAVQEMTRRYADFADAGVRDLKGFNEKLISEGKPKKPHILIIVDELADLMMVAPGEVEESICRLAQLARACGIHLVIATQRPSVDVITGLIKANMPSRVAFAVSSGVDSRTILDMVGAEKLLGKGDMLFYPQGMSKPARVQGAFVPDSDVSKVVDFLKELHYVPGGNEEVAEQVNAIQSASTSSSSSGANSSDSEFDQLFAEAGRFIIDKEKASIGALQRLLKIGFNRAARIMDQLAEQGVVGEEQGTKPREILMNSEQFEELLNNLGL